MSAGVGKSNSAKRRPPTPPPGTRAPTPKKSGSKPSSRAPKASRAPTPTISSSASTSARSDEPQPQPASSSSEPPIKSMQAAVAAARGNAARSFAARINKVFGWSRSAASLLLDGGAYDLVVHIDAAHDNSTLSALQLTRAVEVAMVRRPKAREPLLGVASSIKVQQGDELKLRGAPHVLAGIATHKNGKLVLAPRMVRGKLGPVIRVERASLLAAAEFLHRRLLPRMRARAEEGKARRLAYRAAARLQAARRGQTLRRSHAGLLEAHRARVKAARLRSRKLLASLLRAQYQAPLCTAACFAPPTAEALEASAEARRAWVALGGAEVAVAAARYSQLAGLARSHAASLNRYLGAAPEARKLLKPAAGAATAAAAGSGGGGSQSQARSILGLLTCGPVELTATIDRRGNNSTVGGLLLPRSVGVVRLRINGRQLAAPKNPTALATQKILEGDQVTLRGLPHHVAAVCEVKGGKFAPLTIVPAKARKEEGAAKLKRERLWLLACAERLARSLQGLARGRLAMRVQHKQAHAALVVQIEWAQFVAARLSLRQRELLHTARRAAEAEAASGALAGAEAEAEAAAAVQEPQAPPTSPPPPPLLAAPPPAPARLSEPVASPPVEASAAAAAPSATAQVSPVASSVPTARHGSQRTSARATGAEAEAEEEENAEEVAGLFAEVFGGRRLAPTPQSKAFVPKAEAAEASIGKPVPMGTFEAAEDAIALP